MPELHLVPKLHLVQTPNAVPSIECATATTWKTVFQCPYHRNDAFKLQVSPATMPAHDMYIISVSTTQGTARVNGPKQGAQRLPNTLSISIKGLRASDLLMSLADELAASAGAACHSSREATVSSVLQAMQVSSPSVYILLTLCQLEIPAVTLGLHG